MAVKAGAALVGATLAEIATPALVVDLDLLEANLAAMAEFTARAGVGLRPHAKAHKSVAIARRQLDLGAVGLCCQTIGEAAVFAEARLGPLLITNELVGRAKIERLAEVAEIADVSVCVESADDLDLMNSTAEDRGVTLGVFVELRSAWYRAGVPGPEALVAVAGEIRARSNLRFGGIQAYNAPAQHLAGFSDRVEGTTAFHETVRRAVAGLAEAGIECEAVTGGGTGTFDIEPEDGLFTDIQPGTYAFMDGSYLANRTASGEDPGDFAVALSVLTTVISRPREDIAVVDCGTKGISTTHGMPLVQTFDGDTTGHSYIRSADEHGVVELAGTDPPVGHRFRLVPFNVDPTVNLYDEYVGVRSGRVAEILEVSARGHPVFGGTH